MLTAGWYRGFHLQRVKSGVAWTELWHVGMMAPRACPQIDLEYWELEAPAVLLHTHDQLLSWNDALAWIDEVAAEAPRSGEWPPLVCTVCSRRELADYCVDVQKALLKRKLCFTCNFWFERVERQRIDSAAFIAGGKAYAIGMADPTNPFRGFGGASFFVTFFDTREDIVTSNLWCQGDVPPCWRSQLPDTAMLNGIERPAAQALRLLRGELIE